MCVQASSYTAPSPTAVKSVCFWYCLKHGWVPLPLPKSPGDPMSFHPQPSEPHPGRAVPPLNGCFNDSSCGEDRRLEELLHVQPLISWHFDTSICQKHLSNNLFPIRVSFYCFLLFKKKKSWTGKLESSLLLGAHRRLENRLEFDQMHLWLDFFLQSLKSVTFSQRGWEWRGWGFFAVVIARSAPSLQVRRVYPPHPKCRTRTDEEYLSCSSSLHNYTPQ